MICNFDLMIYQFVLMIYRVCLCFAYFSQHCKNKHFGAKLCRSKGQTLLKGKTSKMGNEMGAEKLESYDLPAPWKLQK